MSATRKDIGDQLRNAITGSGQTLYTLANAAGISAAQVGRFVSGQRGLTLESARKLASVLGLTLQKNHAADVASRILGAISAAPMPLGVLYRRLLADGAAMPLGQFHDALRSLSSAGLLWLSSFTGTMYQLTDPEFCMLAGRWGGVLQGTHAYSLDAMLEAKNTTCGLGQSRRRRTLDRS